MSLLTRYTFGMTDNYGEIRSYNYYSCQVTEVQNSHGLQLIVHSRIYGFFTATSELQLLWLRAILMLSWKKRAILFVSVLPFQMCSEWARLQVEVESFHKNKNLCNLCSVTCDLYYVLKLLRLVVYIIISWLAHWLKLWKDRRCANKKLRNTWTI